MAVVEYVLKGCAGPGCKITVVGQRRLKSLWQHDSWRELREHPVLPPCQHWEVRSTLLLLLRIHPSPKLGSGGSLRCPWSWVMDHPLDLKPFLMDPGTPTDLENENNFYYTRRRTSLSCPIRWVGAPHPSFLSNVGPPAAFLHAEGRVLQFQKPQW